VFFDDHSALIRVRRPVILTWWLSCTKGHRCYRWVIGGSWGSHFLQHDGWLGWRSPC